MKRSIDILGASVLLTILAPAFAILAAVVRITSRGPAIFRQERVGRNDSRFEMLKFRSMSIDNDDSAHREYASRLLRDPDALSDTPDGIFKLQDPRVTRFGRHLRRLSIDELPQLWNVLRGDMSLVGPRPMLDWEVDLLDDRTRRRIEVKPGCTGLWQVSGRSLLSTHQMLEADLEYVDSWTLMMDIGILARTPAAVWGSYGTR